MKLSNALARLRRQRQQQAPPPPPPPRTGPSDRSLYRAAKLLWAGMVTGLLFGTAVVQVFWPTSPWLDVLIEVQRASGIGYQQQQHDNTDGGAPQGPPNH